MTIRQVLNKNENVTKVDNYFRIFTAPHNNFIVYTNGNECEIIKVKLH